MRVRTRAFALFQHTEHHRDSFGRGAMCCGLAGLRKSAVSAPAAPKSVDRLATIEKWEMPTSSIFHMLARGGERFRIIETTVAPSGLISGEVEMLPAVAPCAADPECLAVIKRVVEQVGVENFPQPIKLDDGAWVAYWLVEITSLPIGVKHRVLEMDGVKSVFGYLRNYLKTST